MGEEKDSLHKTGNGSTPDPFSSPTYKKAVWPHETKLKLCMIFQNQLGFLISNLISLISMLQKSINGIKVRQFTIYVILNFNA